MTHHYPVCPLFSIQIGFSNVWMIGKQNVAVDDGIQLRWLQFSAANNIDTNCVSIV
jgi:hypothetical protein